MADRFSGIVVDLVKLRDYSLSESHPRGRHKARVFRSRLGLTANDADLLRSWLMDAAKRQQSDLRETDADEYGRRFVLDFEIATATGSANVRSAWIVLTGQDVIRLTSCYVLR